jgi:hypothetical protein
MILTAVAAAGYVTGQARVTEADQLGVQAAYGNLDQFGLIRIAAGDAIRTVWSPAALQQSVWQAMDAAERRRTVLVAADAILGTWPAAGPVASTVVGTAAASLEQAYRDCAVSVLRWGGPELWEGGPHPLLARAGQSLDEARMTECAVRYWRQLATRCGDHLGARSAVTLQFRERMARAAVAAGHADEAVALCKELVADTEEAAGPGGEQTIAVQASLALAYRAAQTEDSISLAERVVTECERTFGPGGRRPRRACTRWARPTLRAGRDSEAAAVLRRCLAARERAVGLMQPGTIAVRQQLAELYRRTGHADEAIGLYQEALTRVVKAAGPAYPDAVTAREHLAAAYDLAKPDRRRRHDVCAGHHRMGARARVRPRQHLHRPGQPGRHQLPGRPAADGVPAVRSRAGGPLPDQRPRPPGHAQGPLERGRHLPQGQAAARRDWTGRDRPRRLRAAPRPGPLGDPEHAGALAHAYHAAELKRSSAQFDAPCGTRAGPRPDDPLTGEVRVLRNRYLVGRQGRRSPPGRLDPRQPGGPRLGPADPAPGKPGPQTANSARRASRRRGPLRVGSRAPVRVPACESTARDRPV